MPISEPYVVIPLTRGLVTAVSVQDESRVRQYIWYALRRPSTQFSWSAKSDRTDQGRVSLHRFLLNPPDGVQVDHWNMNSLDNRRCNLRMCTFEQQMRNRRKRPGSASQYKGVVRYANNWASRIFNTEKQKEITLGVFCNEIDAANAYDMAAREYFGKFAVLNFPLPHEQPPPVPPEVINAVPNDTSRFVGHRSKHGVSSRFVGVYYVRVPALYSGGAWRFRIRIGGNRVEYQFKTELEAAIARNEYIVANNLPHPLNDIPDEQT